METSSIGSRRAGALGVIGVLALTVSACSSPRGMRVTYPKSAAAKTGTLLIKLDPPANDARLFVGKKRIKVSGSSGINSVFIAKVPVGKHTLEMRSSSGRRIVKRSVKIVENRVTKTTMAGQTTASRIVSGVGKTLLVILGVGLVLAVVAGAIVGSALGGPRR